MHIRRAIMLAIQANLQTLPDFGGVWIQRVPPSRNVFPSITLHDNVESCETLGVGLQPRAQQRVITVEIDAWIRGTVDVEKAEIDMDEAALAIESQMTEFSLIQNLQLISTDKKFDETEPEIHVITLTYHIDYCTTELSPSS